MGTTELVEILRLPRQNGFRRTARITIQVIIGVEREVPAGDGLDRDRTGGLRRVRATS